jgi:hypothetical protein
MKEGYTHIAVVLDSSGSMASIFNDTVAGFNHFLKAQKEAEGEATMTLVEFAQPVFDRGHGIGITNWGPNTLIGGVLNDQVPKVTPNINVKFDFRPITAVEELTKKNYVPNGNTPLLDTIGETILRTGKALAALPESLRPSKVLFVIITDGEENASHFYNLDKVKELTSHQQIVYKWEFMYLGANQDAIQVGSSFGIKASSSMSYGLSAGEIGSTYQVLASKTAAYRAVNATADALNFTEEERKSAKK